MIGSGIFTAPAALANQVGPAGILLYIFIVPAVWLVALSIARLAQLYPEEGSFYTYTKQWGGHTLGMVAISAYFIGLLIAMGLLCQVAGIYFTYLCFKHFCLPTRAHYTGRAGAAEHVWRSIVTIRTTHFNCMHRLPFNRHNHYMCAPCKRELPYSLCTPWIHKSFGRYQNCYFWFFWV